MNVKSRISQHIPRNIALWATGISAIFALSCAPDAPVEQEIALAPATQIDPSLITDPVLTQDITNTKTHQMMPFTAGESRLIKELFHISIEKKTLVKIQGPLSPSVLAYVPNTFTNAIVFCGDDAFAEDFSNTQSAAKFNIFFHEMYHLWEINAKGISLKDTKENRAYSYDSVQKEHLKDYTYEQRGNIVGDYAMRFLFQGTLNQRIAEKFTPEKDAKLIKLVENAFPNAKEMRLRMSRQSKKNLAHKSTSKNVKGERS